MRAHVVAAEARVEAAEQRVEPWRQQAAQHHVAVELQLPPPRRRVEVPPVQARLRLLRALAARDVAAAVREHRRVVVLIIGRAGEGGGGSVGRGEGGGGGAGRGGELDDAVRAEKRQRIGHPRELARLAQLGAGDRVRRARGGRVQQALPLEHEEAHQVRLPAVPSAGIGARREGQAEAPERRVKGSSRSSAVLLRLDAHGLIQGLQRLREEALPAAVTAGM